MTTWLMFALVCVLYFEKERLNEIGRKIYARVRFEIRYQMINWSIRMRTREWR